MHVLAFRKLMWSPRSRDFIQHQEDKLIILSISDTLGHMKRAACVFLLAMTEGLMEEELIMILQLCSPRVSELICWYFFSQNNVCRAVGLHSELLCLTNWAGCPAGMCCLLASLTSTVKGRVFKAHFFPWHFIYLLPLNPKFRNNSTWEKWSKILFILVPPLGVPQRYHSPGVLPGNICSGVGSDHQLFSSKLPDF